MDVRYSPDQNGFKKLGTDELRKSFLIENLFQKNKIPMTYSDIDRSITGSAVPSGKSLKLAASKKEMAANYFCERREIGIINIDGKGSVTIDGLNMLWDSGTHYILVGAQKTFYSQVMIIPNLHISILLVIHLTKSIR